MNYKPFLTDTWTKFSQLFSKFVKKTFVGTRAEWDLLSAAEKKQYDLADFTDDTASGVPIISDTVADGDMNAVTSNAVAAAIEPLNERPTIIKATMVDKTIGDDVRLYPKSFKIQLYLGGGVDSSGKLCSFTLPDDMIFRVGGWGTSFMGVARNTDSGEVTSVVINMGIADNVVTLYAESIPSGYTEIRVMNVTLFSVRLS